MAVAPINNESLDDRLTHEVTSLSTKLVTAVAKQSELEESVLHLHKENSLLRTQLNNLKGYEVEYKNLFNKHNELQNELKSTRESKDKAEAQNAKLQGEVEDLTASLFNEANEMVSNASRETYNFKIKNKKLYEEIDEKNTIINDLQEQLRDLKELFIKIEDKQKFSASRIGTPKLEQAQFSLSSSESEISKTGSESIDGLQIQQLQALIYSPNIRAIRFDLNQYQQDFKSFIFYIIKPDFQFDLQNLKNLKYFRKIWVEELENSFPTIPSLTSTNFINRWQKGKTFWNLIVEGKAIIEPIKGVNETFKLGYKGEKLAKDAPVAIKDPCSFCIESKDDMLEHARLYSLKLLNPDTTSSTSLVSSENHEVIASYPLCNYCLIKLRNICDFFAKLRLIHSNIYKLKQNNQFDEFATVSNNFQFKRNSSSLVDFDNKLIKNPKIIKLNKTEESKIIKLYVMLILIRTKIFWSKIGFWDNVSNVDEVNLDELHYELFQSLIDNNYIEGDDDRETIQIIESEPAKEAASNESDQVREDTKGSIEVTVPVTTSSDNLDGIESVNKAESAIKAATDKVFDAAEQSPAEMKNGSNNPEEGIEQQPKEHALTDIDYNRDDEEFADSSDTFYERPASPLAIPRDNLESKDSKSKQFKGKIDNDLNETMEMLKESLEE